MAKAKSLAQKARQITTVFQAIGDRFIHKTPTKASQRQREGPAGKEGSCLPPLVVSAADDPDCRAPLSDFFFPCLGLNQSIDVHPDFALTLTKFLTSLHFAFSVR
jgi:hypothetical protein